MAHPRCTRAAALLSLLAYTAFVLAAHADPSPVPTPYVRQYYVYKEPFFTKYWWVGFIIIFVAFLAIVLIFFIVIRCHFRESQQSRRRKEIEAHGSSGSGSADGGYDEEGNGSDGNEGEMVSLSSYARSSSRKPTVVRINSSANPLK